MTDTTAPAETFDVPFAETPDAIPATASLVEDELLVEDVSIDGMCGVY